MKITKGSKTNLKHLNTQYNIRGEIIRIKSKEKNHPVGQKPQG